MPPGRIEGGTAIFDGRDLLKMSEKEIRKIRGRRISMIFQDPMTSLNPYERISTQIIEPLLIHGLATKHEAEKQAVRAMGDVGIPDPESRIKQFPHEFSGGMRQRVMIAIAMITKPEILIADEPTTALDVTVQKQILDLINDRREKLGSAVIFITHDLAVISQVCDEVNVMYGGRVVERASSSELFAHPRHAYTRSLLQSIPATQSKGSRLFTIPGLPPSPGNLPPGCAFQARNQVGDSSLCLTKTKPPLEEISPGHWVQNCPGCLASSA